MNVLIACEESQEVCKAFRAKGHEAWSCDLQECSGGHPEWHIKGDVLKILNAGGEFITQDGLMHIAPDKWDLIIAHPPCTYLSNVAGRYYSLKLNAPEKVVRRWQERACAAVFFMMFVAADCPHIAIENPVGFINTAYRKADQVIDPYMFASSPLDPDYVTKRTCLWLKNLPPLKKTNDLPKPNNAEMFGRHPNGRARNWTDFGVGFGPDVAKKRSKTFPGIARAMAEQWGVY